MLKTGDKVRIKSFEDIKKVGIRVNSCNFLSEMRHYCGKETFITGRSNLRNFRVQSNQFAWVEQWLEPVKKDILSDDLFTLE